MTHEPATDAPSTAPATDTAWATQLEAAPDPAIRAKILDPLLACHHVASGGAAHAAPFAVTVRDAAGEVVGGMWGRVGYGVLSVELLAPAPARGGGLGRRVMGLAETEARRRGLTGIRLDTYTVQAPDLPPQARRRGMRAHRRCPPGHSRLFFVKRLADQAPRASAPVP